MRLFAPLTARHAPLPPPLSPSLHSAPAKTVVVAPIPTPLRPRSALCGSPGVAERAERGREGRAEGRRAPADGAGPAAWNQGLGCSAGQGWRRGGRLARSGWSGCDGRGAVGPVAPHEQVRTPAALLSDHARDDNSPGQWHDNVSPARQLATVSLWPKQILATVAETATTGFGFGRSLRRPCVARTMTATVKTQRIDKSIPSEHFK